MRRKHKEYKRSFTWKVERPKTKLHGIEPKKTKFSTTTKTTKDTKQEKSTIFFNLNVNKNCTWCRSCFFLCIYRFLTILTRNINYTYYTLTWHDHPVKWSAQFCFVWPEETVYISLVCILIDEHVCSNKS